MHDNSPEANVIFNLLHEAYEVLSDSEKRNRYNPNSQKQHSNEIAEKYNEILQKQRSLIEEYDRVIRRKDQREYELLMEIKELKNKKNHEAENTPVVDESNEEVNTETAHIEVENQKNELLGTIFLILFAVALIYIIIVKTSWVIIVGIIVIPIWLIFKFFRSFD
jgi:curved DNA-binding protein CbpA